MRFPETGWLTRDKLFGLAVGVILMPMVQQTAPWLIGGVLQSVQERLTFPMLVQRIETVREAMAELPCPAPMADQSVVAEALQWNLRIAHEQEANRHFWSDLFSTDRWNAVEPIPWECR